MNMFSWLTLEEHAASWNFKGTKDGLSDGENINN
jgi:hypothetical protein